MCVCRVRALLAEAQGRKKGDEHPLPWYPPVCVTLAGIPEGPRSYDHIPSMKERTKIPLRLIDHSMRQVRQVDTGRQVRQVDTGRSR